MREHAAASQILKGEMLIVKTSKLPLNAQTAVCVQQGLQQSEISTTNYTISEEGRSMGELKKSNVLVTASNGDTVEGAGNSQQRFRARAHNHQSSQDNRSL